MRRFVLVRTRDVTGVSGVGEVAEGVEFSDHSAVLRWKSKGKPTSTVFYDNVDDLIHIHDHRGTEHENTTELVWIDN